FFSKDPAKNFFQAQPGIEALKNSLGLQNEQLSFVPGNHDKSWDVDFNSDPFVSYNLLVKAFDRDECLQSELPAVKRISPEGAPNPIFLALLDSCTVEGKELAGIGNIGETQIDKLEQKVRAITKDVDDFVLIAAMHHHLLPIYPVEKVNDEYWPDGAPR